MAYWECYGPARAPPGNHLLSTIPPQRAANLQELFCPPPRLQLPLCLKLATVWAPCKALSETSCGRSCHLLVRGSFLSKELSSFLVPQVAKCQSKRQLKSLAMNGLQSELTAPVTESLTPQLKLSLIMFRYVHWGIRLEVSIHEMGV